MSTSLKYVPSTSNPAFDVDMMFFGLDFKLEYAFTKGWGEYEETDPFRKHQFPIRSFWINVSQIFQRSHWFFVYNIKYFIFLQVQYWLRQSIKYDIP